jgi:hypothetical protein
VATSRTVQNWLEAGKLARSHKLIYTAPGLVLALFLISVAPALAQSATVGTPFEILDNSFIVEEAFNQEAGIFQNIFGVRFAEGSAWEFGFTQEWPLPSQTHQLSYTVPLAGLGTSAGVGDVLLNYRYQWWFGSAGLPAFSPRFSIILPSGSEDEGRGAGVVGWQVNLPFSKQQGDLYYHWNGGFTWLPNVSSPRPDGEHVDLFTPHLAASAIWRARPMFNLMLETVAEFEEEIEPAAGTVRTTVLTVSPGFRTGWNVSDSQIILGFAVPLTFANDEKDAAAFVYFSYELPFK